MFKKKQIGTVCKEWKMPTLVIFLTDGDNYQQDEKVTTELLKECSKYPLFFQFIGLGSSSFRYLEHLDEMKGRFIDNANLFKVSEKDRLDLADNDLYGLLLREYPDWIKLAKDKNVLR